MHEGLVDLSTELLAMQDNRLGESEMEARSYRATTMAMDIQADWAMIAPMLSDLYCDKPPVPNP